MKVIHVSAWARAFTQFRNELLAGLRQRGVEQTLYTPSEEVHVAALREDGYDVHIGGVSRALGPAIPFEIASLAAFLKRERFDALIAHQPMGALIGVTAGAVAGVPIRIYSTGGLKSSPDRTGLGNVIMGVGERAIIGLSQHVLLVNQEDLDRLTRDGNSINRMIYVGPRGGAGINEALFNPQERLRHRSQARQSLGLGGDETVIGYVGRLVWEKGLRELMVCAKGLRSRGGHEQPRIVLIGDGPDAEAIRATVRIEGLEDMFLFSGYQKNVSFLMSALDIFVLPSYREGMPTSLLESMAMGIPSIATRVRGAREVVRHEWNGLLVAPRSAADLAAAMMRLIENREAAQEMGMRGAATVHDQYASSRLLPRTSAMVYSMIRGTYRSEDW